MRFSRNTWAVLAAFSLLVSLPVLADDMVSQAGTGQANWTQKVITFTGDGAPALEGPNRAQNAAQARIGAERAAKMSALSQALEVVKGIRIDSTGSAGDSMSASPKIRSAVEGVIKNWSVVDIRYYSDGGVQVDVRVPMDGILTQALLRPDTMPSDIPKPNAPAQTTSTTAPEAPAAAAPGAPPAQPAGSAAVASGTTGVVLLVKGFNITPALAPKVLNEKGEVVYSASDVEDGMPNGVATYLKGEESEARKHKIVTGNPVVVNALRSPNGVDLVVSDKDGVKIRQLGMMGKVLKEGRVLFVQM